MLIGGRADHIGNFFSIGGVLSRQRAPRHQRRRELLHESDLRSEANLVGMVVPKGQTARLTYISEFSEQAKASGLVQQAIERAGLPGYKMASAKRN